MDVDKHSVTFVDFQWSLFSHLQLKPYFDALIHNFTCINIPMLILYPHARPQYITFNILTTSILQKQQF